MKTWKKLATGVGVVAVLGGATALYLLFAANSTQRAGVADDTIALADFKAPDQQAISRGEYVMRAADCAACHTSAKGDFSGGYHIETPFGDITSSNITPDRDSGIGRMTERDFFKAVRHGSGSKGFLYPAMPYTSYVKMSDADMHDLWAYMSTVKPVANKIDELVGLPFPYNQRLAMSGWNMLFFDNTPFAETAGQNEEWNRGRYLVDGAGHCAACHTPRNPLGGPVADKDLQGGSMGVWYAPEITGNPHVGLGKTSVADVAKYLKTGSDGIAVATGPMAEAIENSTQYLNDADLQAISVYLKSMPGSGATAPTAIAATDDVMKRGAFSYEVNCSACHGVKGEGVPGMITGFAGNGAVLANDTANLTHALLAGSRAVNTHTNVTGAGMPAFSWKLDDEESADVLTYIRNSWGNAAPAVTAEEVAAMRKMLAVGEPVSASKD